jgi:hypothetical protein
MWWLCVSASLLAIEPYRGFCRVFVVVVVVVAGAGRWCWGCCLFRAGDDRDRRGFGRRAGHVRTCGRVGY